MAKEIIIYTTTWCAYCKMAKEYFKGHKIAYKEIDVTSDAAAQQEMVEKSGQLGVPVIAIAGEIVVGFDLPRIERLLAA